MKKIVCLLLAAVTAVSLAGCGKSSDDKKLIVGTEAGFAPYEYMEGDKVVGIDMDIAQAIADDMGKELVIKNMEFEGALLAAQKGKVDFVAAGVSINEDRKKKMDFSHEYVSSTDIIVVNKNTPNVTSTEDLNDKIVGVQQGNIADFYVSNPENVTPKDIKRYSKFVQAAEDLKNNKIDCIVMDQYPAQELVTANDSLAIIKKSDGTNDVLFEDKYAIAVKKGNKKLLDEINKVIDKLIADGKIEEFTANHTKTSGK